MHKPSHYINKFMYIYKENGVGTAFAMTAKFSHDKFLNLLRRFNVGSQIAITPQNISLKKSCAFFLWKNDREAIDFIDKYINKSCTLDGMYTVVYGKERLFANDEVVLIAHWDPDKIIDPYVVYMGQKLKDAGKKVVICSSAPLAKMPDKLDWLDAVVCRTCPGYDFTSWKAAFEAFPSLFSAREVTLTNDSVFAPIGSYNDVYTAMDSVECDYWGLTFSKEILPHMQSFHFVLRSKALRSKAFKKFIITGKPPALPED